MFSKEDTMQGSGSRARATATAHRLYADVLTGPPPAPDGSPTPPVSYADAVRTRKKKKDPGKNKSLSPSPPVIGNPKVSLPFSQLVLGRTSPPWNASAWRIRGCRVVADDDDDVVLRVTYPAECGLSAVPRGLPARDVTLHYCVRFAEGFRWGEGGTLPGLAVGDEGGASCRLAWQRDGGVTALVYTGAAYTREGRRPPGEELFAAARFRLRRDAQWNAVVVRVKLNTFDYDDEDVPVADGALSVCVNGKAATLGGVVWRRSPRLRISSIDFSTRAATAAGHADFARVALIT